MNELKDLQARVTPANRRPMLIKGACVALLMAVLGGCASTPVSTRAPEEIVAERAQARWEGFIKGDLVKAYQYNTPGYRGMVSQKRFQETRGRDGRVIGAEVFRTTCEAKEKCVVRLKLTAYAPLTSGNHSGMPTKISTAVDETWILEDGQWWYFEKI